MFDDLIDWFKGLFGGAAEEAVQGVSDTLGAGVESGQDAAAAFGEEAAGGVAEAQALGEEALGGVAQAGEGFQEQADTVSGVVEDPGGAATDAARNHLFGDSA
ncbi:MULTISPECIES: hypothetical protein [unclassified Nocardiopsis]|uniref:hypothetical protein n=1 Tax=unclassified Nocardiopsis TaxID=2649073 RepID=UPI00135686A2|nr:MULTISPECIES: hypothetical protein [unclassified Nocardiopsis]